jgi:hypothetical protein
MADTSGNTTTRRKRPAKNAPLEPDREPGPLAIEWLEYHRNAVALVPSAEDADPGVAMMRVGVHGDTSCWSCNCSQWASQTCRHMRLLSATFNAHQHVLGSPDLDGPFRSSLWYEIAAVLAEGCRDTPNTVEIKRVSRDPTRYAYNLRGKSLCAYFAADQSAVRFCERCCESFETGNAFSRGDILNQLSRLALTESEYEVMVRGLQTRRQAMEQSFWYRMAYHGFRELGARCLMRTDIDSRNHCRLTFLDAQQTPVFCAFIDPEKLRRLVDLLARNE